MLVWGFAGEFGKNVVDALNERSKTSIIWIGNHPEAINIFSFFRPFNGNLSETDQDCYEACEREGMLKFIDMFSRHYPEQQYTFHELRDFFRNVFLRVYEIIKSNQIQEVLFSNLPHEGPDYLIYLIAKYYDMSTMMCYQSLQANRFFYTSKLEDFGHFKTCLPKPTTKFKVAAYDQDQWFYMSNASSVLTKQLRLKYVRPLLKRDFKKITKEGVIYFRQNKFQNEWRNLVKNKPGDLNASFIYFPLPLQPELTTVSIGDSYVDQVLALERLSNHLPIGWEIIVKENPKQTEFQRGEIFFDRLRNIDNVTFVDIKTPTNELILKSKMVSVVTGTAGWEALRAAKPVIVFGRPWYLTLPGVTKYHDGIDLLALLDLVPSLEEVELGYNELMKYTREGVVDFNYIKILEDFDSMVNAKHLAAQINEIFNKELC